MRRKHQAAFRLTTSCRRQLISVPLTDCGKKTADMLFVLQMFTFADCKSQDAAIRNRVREAVT